jgi:hypothetical protein
MILKVVERCVEESMYAVPDDLVDHAAVLDHDTGNALEILVERCDQFLGTGAMHRSSETLDVGEQYGDLAPLASELDQVRPFDDAADDRRRKMLFEPLAYQRFAPAR